PDDALTGDWSGRVQGDALPSGVDATLSITKTDNAYTATLASDLFALTSKSAEFDPETGSLTMTLESDDQTGRAVSGSFEGTLSDGGIAGDLVLEPLGWELPLTATRHETPDSDEANDDEEENLADLVLEDDHKH